MKEQPRASWRKKPAVHWAPWEKTFDRVLTPIEEFIQQQSTSSVLLMICAVLALVIANSSIGPAYQHLLHQDFSWTIVNKTVGMSILHWVNDGLMAIFFLIMGLELKREWVVGELSDVRRALLPIIAAIGGMLVPALIYFFINPSGVTSNGWGISMATDIAFAVGALTLLGNRVPRSLVIFLIALAIVDDLGAVMVIALFYTKTINGTALLWSVLFTIMLVILNLGGVRRLTPYVIAGFALWCSMLSSGVHATIAGVILGFSMPVRPKYNPEHFLRRASALLRHMKNHLHKQHEEWFYSQVATLERGVELVQTPATRLQHGLHVSVAYIVIPVFALVNAAIPVDFNNMSDQLFNQVTLGVVSGLVIGKFIGITGVTWLAVKAGVATLPDDLDMRHIIGVGLLGGIGFTMSIFIADLAFAGYPHELLMAKTGILCASLLAGVLGISWLWICSSTGRSKAMS